MGIIKLGYIGTKLNTIRKKLLFGARYSSESYIRELNRLGARIDESAGMVQPETIFIDTSAPYMLEIGKNVCIAGGVTILTHDACWLIMKANDGRIRGHIAPVKIGNNVFIGMNSTVLCNVTICDNVIISANSVVSSSLNVPGVYAGNPAKLVISYENYCALRENRQVREAYVMAREYVKRYGVFPPETLFNEYFWIFAERDLTKLPEAYKKQMQLCGNYEKSCEDFLNTEPDFDGFSEFRKFCEKKFVKDKVSYVKS